MARSLSVDSGYDRWKDSAVEQRSREPIGTFPSVTVRTGRSGNITDALVSTTEYQTNSGEKGEAQVQGMSGASVDGSGPTVTLTTSAAPAQPSLVAEPTTDSGSGALFPQCLGLTKKNKRCEKRTQKTKETGYCHDHQDQKETGKQGQLTGEPLSTASSAEEQTAAAGAPLTLTSGTPQVGEPSPLTVTHYASDGTVTGRYALKITTHPTLGDREPGEFAVSSAGRGAVDQRETHDVAVRELEGSRTGDRELEG